MNQYRMDYISLHDNTGHPNYKTQTDLSDYVPALKNGLAYFAFLQRVHKDSEKFNVEVSFDFYVNRSRHYGYLYVDVPKAFTERLNFYRKFIMKMIKG